MIYLYFAVRLAVVSTVHWASDFSTALPFSRRSWYSAVVFFLSDPDFTTGKRNCGCGFLSLRISDLHLGHGRTIRGFHARGLGNSHAAAQHWPEEEEEIFVEIA